MSSHDAFGRRSFLVTATAGLAAALARASDPQGSRPASPEQAAHGLTAGSILEPGGRRTSPNGRFSLVLQPDGNLVWLDRNRVLWHSGTDGAKSAKCHMQSDGNLVVYGVRSDTSGALWASGTVGREGAWLACQTDGNLVVYQGSEVVWTSNTAVGPIATAAAQVKVKEKWGADHLYDFLNALPPENMLAIKQALGVLDEKAGRDQLKGKSQDVRDIQRHALWLSSNIFAYPFKESAALNYHELVTWVAVEPGVDRTLIDEGNTFAIEREIQKQLFAQLWDKMNEEQRKELLGKIDSNGSIKDHAAVASLGGAGALGTLSATVYFAGFAFYTTMSVTISTVAGFFGLTLPFAVYTSASSLVAFLCGPVGWALLGLAALGGLALAGRANVKKTTAFICQIHALKVAALMAAETAEGDVFQK